jgi:hypothetical protein
LQKIIAFSACSITDEENTLKGKLKSPADVERLKKTFNFGKIVRITICVADSYRKVENIMHHASLKNIFEKLIIINGPTRLDLKNPPLTGGMGVSIETL